MVRSLTIKGELGDTAQPPRAQDAVATGPYLPTAQPLETMIRGHDDAVEVERSRMSHAPLNTDFTIWIRVALLHLGCTCESAGLC